MNRRNFIMAIAALPVAILIPMARHHGFVWREALRTKLDKCVGGSVLHEIAQRIIISTMDGVYSYPLTPERCRRFLPPDHPLRVKLGA